MNDHLIGYFIDPRTSRILIDLYSNKRVTVKGLCERNPSIPRSTMYRLLTRMERDGMVTVVEYIQKRGTVEKTYALCPEALELGKDPSEMTNGDIVDLFIVYAMEFASQFRRYADSKPGKVDMVEPRGFWTAPVYATDREMNRLIEQFGQTMSEFTSRDAEGERKLHSIGLIVAPSVPSPEGGEE